MYNRTIAVINGTSPTSANPVALLASSSFPLGGLFIPSQPSAEGGSLWFPSIGLNSSRYIIGNYTVAGIPPVINSLSVTPNLIDEGSSVTVSSSTSFGVGVLSYSYSGLPAGLVSRNMSSISGTPSVAGTFSIKLTVTDAAGESVSASVQLTVNAAITATISYSPGVVDVGQPVQFTVALKGGEAPYTEQWVFGDGYTGSGVSPYHVFNSSGGYDVAVTVTDALGNSYTANVSVNVSLPPSDVTILASRNVVDAGLPVTFTAEAQFGSAPLSYAWKLGDGSTSSSLSFNHSYSAAGTYVVKLTVTDAAGQSSSAAYTILVLPDPQAAINSIPTITPNTSATFSAAVSGGLAPYSYHWSFGDGSQSTLATPTHAYASKGTYQVKLTVTDSEGYSTNSYFNVTVAGSSSTSPTRSTSSSGISGQNPVTGYLLLGGGLVAGFVVGAVIVTLLISRKRKPPV
ncbi:MAG: PKD domain-containing protein [Candidatus Thermoplasmatota archaeon]|nr:PKD domain-containing protein [Candidatus Thermoplasmatota archaeon]